MVPGQVSADLFVAIQLWTSFLFSKLAWISVPCIALGALNPKIIFQMLFTVVSFSSAEHVELRRLGGKLQFANMVSMGQGIRGNREGLNSL